MTVTYTYEVATNGYLGCFLKLLIRWKGSIYKLVWVDLLAFLLLYFFLNVIYLYVLDETGREFFEKVVRYCAKYGSLIPLTFVLGFYVNIVMTRWWSQYTSIPFPDNLAILVGASIKGQGERARIVRRTIVRYVCVTFTITLTMMSPKVKKRFPTLDHFIKAGLLNEDEKKVMETLDTEYPSYSKYWLPLAWSSNIVTRARHEGLIRDDVSVKTILEELNLFRSKCGGMLDFDWISIPLVYTQVVTLATYSYFLTALMGQQFIEPIAKENQTDTPIFYFPFLPVLEFFFYIGWLKVAETLINPFGEDDDDFESNWMIDRHIQVCYLLVDRIHQDHPKLMKDVYWRSRAPNYIPYTKSTLTYLQDGPIPSTANVKIKKEDQDIVMADASQTDGNLQPPGSVIWGLMKGVRRRGMAGSQIDLNNIVTGENTPVDSSDEVNDYADSRPISFEKTNIIYSEEFEQLKQERLEQRRKKLLTILDITKKSTDEQVHIINDIIK